MFTKYAPFWRLICDVFFFLMSLPRRRRQLVLSPPMPLTPVCHMIHSLHPYRVLAVFLRDDIRVVRNCHHLILVNGLPWVLRSGLFCLSPSHYTGHHPHDEKESPLVPYHADTLIANQKRDLLFAWWKTSTLSKPPNITNLERNFFIQLSYSNSHSSISVSTSSTLSKASPNGLRAEASVSANSL